MRECPALLIFVQRAINCNAARIKIPKASFVGAEVAGGGYEERKPTFQFCFHVVMVVGRVE